MTHGDIPDDGGMDAAEFAKLMGGYPDPPENPLYQTGGGFMDNPGGFAWVANAEDSELADLTADDVREIAYQFHHGGKPSSGLPEGDKVGDVEGALMATDWFSTRHTKYGDEFLDEFYDNAFEIADTVGVDSGDEMVNPKMLQVALDKKLGFGAESDNECDTCQKDKPIVAHVEFDGPFLSALCKECYAEHLEMGGKPNVYGAETFEATPKWECDDCGVLHDEEDDAESCCIIECDHHDSYMEGYGTAEGGSSIQFVCNECGAYGDGTLSSIDWEHSEKELSTTQTAETFEAYRENLPEWPPAARHIITGIPKETRKVSDEYRCGPVYKIDGEWSWCNGGSGRHGHIDGGGSDAPLCGYCGMNMETQSFNAPYAGAGAIMGIAKDTPLEQFTDDELTKSSAIHGDFDTASLDYSGHQNIEVRAEDEGDNSYCANCLRAYTYDEEDDAYIMVEEGDEFYTDENYGVLCRECHPDFQHEDSFGNWTRKRHLAVRPYSHEKGADTDAYTYAYTEGHSDSRKNEGFNPSMDKGDSKDFHQILRQKAEMESLTSDIVDVSNRIGETVGRVRVQDDKDDMEDVFVEVENEDGDVIMEGKLEDEWTPNMEDLDYYYGESFESPDDPWVIDPQDYPRLDIPLDYTPPTNRRRKWKW